MFVVDVVDVDDGESGERRGVAGKVVPILASLDPLFSEPSTTLQRYLLCTQSSGYQVPAKVSSQLRNSFAIFSSVKIGTSGWLE